MTREQPAWSPDGSDTWPSCTEPTLQDDDPKILEWMNADWQPDIWRNLTDNRWALEACHRLRQPAWYDPDGTTDRSTLPTPPDTGAGTSMMWVSGRGRNPSTQQNLTSAGPGSDGFLPSWSPDGTMI